MMFFKSLLDMKLSPNISQFIENMDEIAERDKQIHWKIKGMAAKITYRLFSKYGNPKYADEEHKAFH